VFQTGFSRKFFEEISAQDPTFTLDRDRGSCTFCPLDTAILIVQLVGKHQQTQHLFNKMTSFQ
jgi:hypothetical protein